MPVPIKSHDTPPPNYTAVLPLCTPQRKEEYETEDSKQEATSKYLSHVPDINVRDFILPVRPSTQLNLSDSYTRSVWLRNHNAFLGRLFFHLWRSPAP